MKSHLPGISNSLPFLPHQKVIQRTRDVMDQIFAHHRIRGGAVQKRERYRDREGEKGQGWRIGTGRGNRNMEGEKGQGGSIGTGRENRDRKGEYGQGERIGTGRENKDREGE